MKILIGGDFYPAERLKNVVAAQNYDEIFEEIIPLIRRVDYSIVNFESPVVLGDYPPLEKCGPNLSSTKYAIEAIAYAGFNMVTLSNNHILDYGEQGLYDTLKTCSEYKIDTVGAGENLFEASKIFYVVIEDKRLAIINCCEHEFSIATEWSAGANPLNPVQQYYQIREACKRADFTLVIVHGGHEHFQLPSLRMVENYRFFVDAGADVVVNHHQHCYSGYEIYRGKPIFYGLGNLCFDRRGQMNTEWNKGFLLELDFQNNNITFELHPYLQCNGDSCIKLLKEMTKWYNDIKNLNAIISDTKLLQQECNLFYQTKRWMLMIFEPYNNRLMNKLYRLGVLPSFLVGKKKNMAKNFIDCEAHRDILTYLMNNNKLK